MGGLQEGLALRQGKSPLFMAMALAILLGRPVSGMDRPEWEGGAIMGYNLGQNGAGWPKPWKEPLANNNRGGFYLSQTRVKATLPFDSTFSAVIVANVLMADVQEAYLRKTWGSYRFLAGKFRGAGLKSGSGTDEFDFTTIQRPRYARLWNHYKKLHNFRDFGIQGEKDFLDGRLRNKLFFHNANGQNVFNDEPSFPAGPSTQALGLDYSLDFQVSRYSTVGGHVGALANQQWDEFIGSHDFWEAQYWFKSNPIVDASLNHQMDFPRFHILNEALAMWNRTMPTPPDGHSTLTWGVSSLARFDHSPRWSPYFGYEFVDHTDGYYPGDAIQMFKLGTVFRPSPDRYAGLKVTGQYVRALEEAGRNTVGNDILHAQLQMVF